MFKNKLYNYIAFEILKSYILVLFSLSLLVWIVQAAKFLSLITENGLSIEIYITYIFFIFPKTLSQLIIVSFLVSLFFSILKLNENKELEIYWLSGISKIQIAFVILKISCFLTLLSLMVHIFLVPATNLKSREILTKSEFSMVNSLVKKNNFNSPLRKLTIFVNKNDNQGNIEKIFIFENTKTIIAKKGRVLNIKNKNYLELLDGFIHEKNKNNNIEVVKFDKTLFDFTKYQTNITKYPKFNERNIYSLINSYKNPKLTNESSNALYEIHRRIIKPFFLPIVALMCCFLLYENKEKINLLKLKIFIFSAATVFIILTEVLINLSIVNIYFKLMLYFSPFLLAVILIKILKNFFKTESIS